MNNSVAAARPPLFNKKNYSSYWKVKVKAYIKVINERSWRFVVTGWTYPIVTTDEVITIKFEEALFKEKNSLAIVNIKALNIIFASFDTNQFKFHLCFYIMARDTLFTFIKYFITLSNLVKQINQPRNPNFTKIFLSLERNCIRIYHLFNLHSMQDLFYKNMTKCKT